MGINFRIGELWSHAQWSYSGFNRFRARLCKSIGLKWLEVPLSANQKQSHNIALQKIVDSEHPLVALLAHSDCDGELSPRECAEIAPALEAILEDWPPDEFDHDLKSGFALVRSMKDAVRLNKPLEFC